MLLRRSNTYPDFWDRKKFTGPLDIRAPEDHLIEAHERERDASVSSPAVRKALGDFVSAVQSGGIDEMKRMAQRVVVENSAHFRMSGVPTFAHDPVPWQLIKFALPVEQLKPGEQTKEAVGRFVDLFEDSVKPMLKSQIAKFFEQTGPGEAFKFAEAGRKVEQSDHPRPSELQRPTGELDGATFDGASNREHKSIARQYPTRLDWASRFADVPGEAKHRPLFVQGAEDVVTQESERRQTSDQGAMRFHNANHAGMRTSSLDSIVDSQFDGQPNVGGGPRGEATPLAFPVVVGVVLRERAVKAAKGAGYAMASDLIVTLLTSKGEKLPTLESLFMSGLGGAASGVVDFGPDQWKYEAGLAFLGSAAEDTLEGKPTRWFAALGAGVGAGLFAKYGKAAFKAKFGDRIFAQSVGKAISKLIKEVFSAHVELAAAEAAEFIEGFKRAVENADEAAEHWEKQFDEWFWQDDKDPIL